MQMKYEQKYIAHLYINKHWADKIYQQNFILLGSPRIGIIFESGKKINGWTAAPSSGTFLKPHACNYLGLKGNLLDPNN